MEETEKKLGTPDTCTAHAWTCVFDRLGGKAGPAGPAKRSQLDDAAAGACQALPWFRSAGARSSAPGWQSHPRKRRLQSQKGLRCGRNNYSISAWYEMVRLVPMSG